MPWCAKQTFALKKKGAAGSARGLSVRLSGPRQTPEGVAFFPPLDKDDFQKERLMNRRNFLQLAGATAGASVMNSSMVLPQGSNGSAPRTGLMKVGTQHGSSDEILEVLCSLGVNNICSSLPSAKMDAAWTVEGLTKLRERVESYGIHLDMIPLPLSSAYITKAELPSIMMAKSPDRDRDIDTVCQM